ncbi:hypothetical protein JB92DRAFT_2827917 [Gautieria morchelliformis]|nr:hypothetical protein JB92DRAFT_2827917 [Gautieria morchelliformis]
MPVQGCTLATDVTDHRSGPAGANEEPGRVVGHVNIEEASDADEEEGNDGISPCDGGRGVSIAADKKARTERMKCTEVLEVARPRGSADDMFEDTDDSTDPRLGSKAPASARLMPARAHRIQGRALSAGLGSARAWPGLSRGSSVGNIDRGDATPKWKFYHIGSFEQVHTVIVDYELSLSDTASLASMEEYDPNSSDLTLAREPLNGYSEGYDLEDDAITVSSRDTASIPRGVPALRIASRPNLRTLSPVLSDDSPPASSLGTASGAHAEHDRTALPAGRGKENDADSQSHVVIPHDSHPQTAVGETPEESLAFDKNSTGVFDRLKQLEVGEQGDYVSQEAKRLSQTERGVQWLRDQNVRAIQSMFGALPEPSVSEDTESVVFVEAPDEALVGDLALQQDPRGKYYYTYTSSSNASQMQEEASDPPDGGSIIESGYVSVGHEEPSPEVPGVALL